MKTMMKRTAKTVSTQVKTSAKNWRTSLIGIIGAGVGYVAMFPEEFNDAPSWIVKVAKYAVLGGFAGFGLIAKDGTVTGTVANPRSKNADGTEVNKDLEKTDEGPAA